MKFSQPLPLSLYVHYPWCAQKCPYCDFNSHSQKKQATQYTERAYLQAMVDQLVQTLPQVWGRKIGSIFFGGGTPSLMSVEGLDWFLSQTRALLAFGPEVEITLEANPGTVDFEKFAGFRQAGVNRLSLGIQSFSDEKLQALGRIHSADEAYLAVQAAKRAGFDNFNLDLMFALPNQSLVQALEDVSIALSLAPPHLSHYQLTLEPNTPFYKSPPVLPDEDSVWEMQSACQQALKQQGYDHYEVSAFAKDKRWARHNLNYWQFGDYIGLGAGAHGKLTIAPEGKILRTQMPASPGGYMQMMAEGKQGRTTEVSADEVVFEFMLNALRLQKGFDLSLFNQTTGLSPEVIAAPLSHLMAQKWLVKTNEYVQLTDLGQRFLNDVLQVFLELPVR